VLHNVRLKPGAKQQHRQLAILAVVFYAVSGQKDGHPVVTATNNDFRYPAYPAALRSWLQSSDAVLCLVSFAALMPTPA
jgi:hypothetical protein